MADYVVATVWWPDGWEPTTPLDVPKCLSLPPEQTAGGRMTYPQAVAAVRGLNRQNMDHPGARWFVVAKVKDEPAAAGGQAAGREAATIDADRLEVVEPAEGSGRGDCSHCPAHHLPCATEP
jgi:hypothetical protein